MILFIVGGGGPGADGVIGSLLPDKIFHIFQQDPGLWNRAWADCQRGLWFSCMAHCTHNRWARGKVTKKSNKHKVKTPPANIMMSWNTQALWVEPHGHWRDTGSYGVCFQGLQNLTPSPTLWTFLDCDSLVCFMWTYRLMDNVLQSRETMYYSVFS